jgi:hypothetical protein
LTKALFALAQTTADMGRWGDATGDLPRAWPERRALTVRLDLLAARPPIWRRLKLASDLDLEQVHVIVQESMGWKSAHLHSFDDWRPVGSDETKRLHLNTRWEVENGEEHGTKNEWDVELSQVLRTPKDWLGYVYDFGDNWRHRLKLEKVEAWTEGDPPAQCLTGRRACPPEDCGGIWGYEALLARLAAFNDSAGRDEDVDEDTSEWVEWFGLEDFDPDDFDPEEANIALSVDEEGGFMDLSPF